MLSGNERRCAWLLMAVPRSPAGALNKVALPWFRPVEGLEG